MSDLATLRRTQQDLDRLAYSGGKAERSIKRMVTATERLDRRMQSALGPFRSIVGLFADLAALEGMRKTMNVASEHQKQLQPALSGQSASSANTPTDKDDFSAGFAQGFRDFVEEMKSAFELAQEAARKTAHAMQQSFKELFFDLFRGEVRSLGDVLKRLERLGAEILSNVLSAFATHASNELLRIIDKWFFGDGLPGGEGGNGANRTMRNFNPFMPGEWNFCCPGMPPYPFGMPADAQTDKGGFLDGLAQGFGDFAAETKSVFGLAQEAARKTAQAMQQSFKQFFFHAFRGEIRSLSDVLRNFERMALDIIANLVASWATKGLGNLLSSIFSWGSGIFSSLFGGAAGAGAAAAGSIAPTSLGFPGPSMWAHQGGIVPGVGFRDTVPILATPGEGVLSHRGMAALGRLNRGETLRGGNVVVNVVNNSEEKAEVSRRRTPDGTTIDVVIGQTVSQQIRNGGPIDAVMRSTYGLNRVGVVR